MRRGNIAGRLERAERARGCGGRACPECGWPADGSTPARVTITVPMPRVIGEPAPPRDEAAGSCRVCGRTTVLEVPPPRLIESA